MAVQLKNNQQPGRNQPCPCGSQLKFKYCHGDESKRNIANRVANLKMVELIKAEQKKHGVIPYDYACNSCGHGFDKPGVSTIVDQYKCPKCDSLDLKHNIVED